MTSNILRKILVNLDIVLQIFTLVGLVLCVTPWKKWGKIIVMVTLIPLFVVVLTPFGPWMMTHLENRFYPQKSLPTQGGEGISLKDAS